MGVEDSWSEDAHQRMWALGDCHRFATTLMWGHGPRLVAACDIHPGQRVLDVGAGTGNVALRAAEAGADVVALDLVPENVDRGRREAEARGALIDWVVGDAEDMPFGDAEFDVVTSSFGVMFAPHHEAAAAELLRVCRPNGTIGLLAFTPDGLGGEFFRILSPYAPPPAPGAGPPWLWGDEDHVRGLLGSGCAVIRTRRDTYVESAASPEDYVDLFTTAFGPVVAMREALADSPARRDAFDADLLTFARTANEGLEGGRAMYRYEYLSVLAQRASA